MVMRSKMISPHVRETLEYAEAIKLLINRRIVEQLLERINEDIRLVRRIAPSVVEQARKDIGNHNSGDVLELATVLAKPKA